MEERIPVKAFRWVFLAVILLLAACAAKTAEGYVTIGIDEVQPRQSNGAIVVDVREVEEFEEGHISGAINVPLSEFKKGNRADLDSDKGTYIVICRSGNRSKEVSDILFEEGYDVVNVSEGMSSWSGEVER